MSENIFKNQEVWQGITFWSDQIKKAGIYQKLLHFNDVIVEKRPPNIESGYHKVLSDIILDGKECDIYHTDQDENGEQIKGSTYHRVFIHIKDRLN